MSARVASALIAVSFALIALGGCASAPGVTEPSFTPIARAPRLTPVPLPTVAIPDVTPAPTPTPIQGGVDGAEAGPVLSVQEVDADTIKVTLEDPAAKAWRLVVGGTGTLAADRWEILVETGDVEPLITAREIRDGNVVDVLDLTGFGSETAAAGGCHSILPVCLDSTGFSLPAEGDGTFSVRLDLPEAGVPLTIRGGTAGWPSEPFVLGPWTDTEAFPWAG